MYRHYNPGAREDAMFLSSLCADNERFTGELSGKEVQKKYDLLFSGRIVELKNPLFIADVAEKVKAKRGRCSVLIMGDGDRSSEGRHASGNSEKARHSVRIRGLRRAQQASRIHAGPDSSAPHVAGLLGRRHQRRRWFRACPSSPATGPAAAGELVIDGKNGYVLPLDAERWADKIAQPPENRDRLEAFAENARETVREFNFVRAAEGIIAAIRYAESRK